MKRPALLLSTFVLFLGVWAVKAQDTAYDLRELRDMRASSAEDVLRDKGYTLVDIDKTRTDIYQNWWSRSRNKCVTVRISDGRVQSVVNVPKADCGKDKGYSNNNNRYGKESGSSQKFYKNFNQLEGWAATDAYDELKRRGFREGKSHKDGGKTYRVWHNPNTDQCLKTLSVDKRIKEIITSNRCN